MGLAVFVGIAGVLLALHLLRRMAARRVAAGDGRFVWLVFPQQLVVGITLVWVSIGLAGTAPVVGAILAVGDVVYLAILVRFLTRMSRAVRAAGGQGDSGVMVDLGADYMLSMIGLLLLGGILAVVGIIVWGVTQAAR